MRYLLPATLAAFVALGGVALVYAADTDGDDWSDSHEVYSHVDATRACPVNLANHAWPPDMNNDRDVDTGDIAQVTNNFGKPANDMPPAGATRTHDIDNPTADTGSGFIDTADLVQQTQRFGDVCTP